MALYEFIVSNRDGIIARSRDRAAARTCPRPTDAELGKGIPKFVDELADALRVEQSTPVIDHTAIARSAGRHGRDLLRTGLTVAQVVHGYGDVCQAITELATEQENAISATEFGRLNLCLDDAIASAVTEFARHRERRINEAGTERLGILAHEMRNLLNVATLAFDSIKTGNVAPNGSTGRVMDRTLIRFRDLIDRSLAEVRLEAGVEHFERMSAAEFLEEVEIGAVILAKSREIDLTVTSVDPAVVIDGDRQLLAAAVTNLLQNAFKFTHAKGRVALRTVATAHRVLFEVEDECGGLPTGKIEELFRPYEQRGDDRSGIGLGLVICSKAAKANGGELRVRDLPGKGCVFTIDLPRQPSPTPSVTPPAT